MLFAGRLSLGAPHWLSEVSLGIVYTVHSVVPVTDSPSNSHDLEMLANVFAADAPSCFSGCSGIPEISVRVRTGSS